eukprot:CAMPEP_0206057150 /NCGR_PEP_ID=MMETSP1466-20131121/43758_1 /ASSEMBLY_ACC=CAM_ASM_001126 /TAXON_ID=44452 /ORGANISM="Pavlova gyrans, Strain CCMP608" /LENGTH=82 /DNA_ID=CAMNT_0053432417 /DNA_START=11 /DNA_END=256 /DNA_ORIENTATION=+
MTHGRACRDGGGRRIGAVPSPNRRWPVIARGSGGVDRDTPCPEPRVTVGEGATQPSADEPRRSEHGGLRRQGERGAILPTSP